MADKKDVSGATGTSTMLASLAGAAVGAAVGAGAIILSDKKNRKKLEEALEGLKKQGFDVMDIVTREAETVKTRLESARDGAGKKAKKAVKRAARPSTGGKAKKKA